MKILTRARLWWQREPGIRFAWAAIGAVVAVAALSVALILARQPSARLATMVSPQSAPAGQVSIAPAASRARDRGSKLEVVRARQLRVLTLGAGDSGSGDAATRALLGAFAREQGLGVVWLPVATRVELAQALRSGRGDLTIDELALEDDSDRSLLRTAPVRSERYVAVSRTGTAPTNSTADFIDRRVAVQPGAPVWPVLVRLADAFPRIRLLPQSDALDPATMLDGLVRGDWDFVVGSWTQLRTHLGTRPGLQIAFDLTPDRPVAWATRKTAPRLRAALDEFLHRSPLYDLGIAPYAEDLAGIRARGVLRAATWRDRSNFYLEGGDPRGFEYELAARFAAAQKLRLVLTVVETPAEMIAALKQGRADLIIARNVANRADYDPMLATSVAYHHVAPVVLTHDAPAAGGGAEPRLLTHAEFLDPVSLEDLTRSGNRITTLGSAPEWAVAAVVTGVYDGVVVDSTLVPGILEVHPQLRAAATVAAGHSYRWTLRAGDRALRESVDGFLRSAYRQADFIALRDRYFGPRALARPLDAPISPYDALARRYAREYGFDWRLLVAQMFTESRFDPGAISASGATGLMQMLPGTARMLGYRELRTPEQAVRAGVQYLDTLRARFEPQLPIAERTWFALAAYHAGYDRVRRARARAEAMGLDPNRWFGAVETAMARHTAVDPSLRQTIAYVREIRACYSAYQQYAPALKVADVATAVATES